MTNHSDDAADAAAYRRAHNPLRTTLARNRAKNRGPVPCGVPGCRHSFGNERNAEQHRLHKHGIVPEKKS